MSDEIVSSTFPAAHWGWGVGGGEGEPLEMHACMQVVTYVIHSHSLYFDIHSALSTLLYSFFFVITQYSKVVLMYI